MYFLTSVQLPAAKLYCGKSHSLETAFQQRSLLHDKVNSAGTTTGISVGCSYWLEINGVHVNTEY